jgi:hypothetical protein
MLKLEIRQLLDHLKADVTVARSLTAIADGDASNALKNVTLTMLQAKCFAFLGYYLPDDAFKDVVIDLCFELHLLESRT